MHNVTALLAFDKISTNKIKVKDLGSPLRAEPSKTNSRYLISSKADNLRQRDIRINLLTNLPKSLKYRGSRKR